MESPPTTRHQRLMPGCSIICESTCIGLVAMVASPAVWRAVSVAGPSPVHELKLHGELVGRLERRAVQAYQRVHRATSAHVLGRGQPPKPHAKQQEKQPWQRDQCKWIRK